MDNGVFSFVGTDVAGLGDINGDGIEDFVVSTGRPSQVGGVPSLHAYVVFGGTGLGNQIDLNQIDDGGAGGFRISGQHYRFIPAGNGGSTDALGHQVSNIGDINGDGFNDIAVQAAGAFVGGTDSSSGAGNPANGISGPNTFVNGADRIGATHIILGGTDTADIHADQLLTEASTRGFSITHAGGGDISSVGDVNGDGLDDLLIGNAIVYGQTSTSNFSINDVGIVDNTLGFRITGVPGGINSSTGIGDFNGDGITDFLIGSTGAERAYVVFGQAAQTNIDVTGIETGGANGFALINSSGIDFNLGSSVAPAGDINGDGFDDVIVSAPYQYEYDYYTGGGTSQAGETFVVYGNDSGDTAPIDVATLNDSGSTITVDNTGTVGNDVIEGNANSEILLGGLGNDTISGNGGADVINGGAGDDIIILSGDGGIGSFVDNVTALQSGPSDSHLASVDGGSGEDVLVLDGADIVLDFANIDAGRIEGIEQIDITGNGDNSLTLDLADVLDLSDTSNQLTITGDAGDTVNLTGGFTDSGSNQTIDGTIYDVYLAGNATVLINEDILPTI